MSQSPSIPGQTTLIPVNDCVLIKLDRTDRKESKYDTRTSGIVAAIAKIEETTRLNTREITLVLDLLHKRVYFEEYKEGARIKRDGELFCFIKIEDIRGYEDVKTD
jgi:co-chaperonin GroES (HSP10)